MGMKPRLSDPNKKIDPKLATEPKPDQGREEYTKLHPFTVTERRIQDNQSIPGVVSCPRKHGG